MLKEKTKKIKKVVKKSLCILGGVTLIALLFVGVYKLGTMKGMFKPKEDIDLFEEAYSDDVDITIYDVQHQLDQIGELASAMDTYNGSGKIEDVKKETLPVLGEVEIPGTYHCVEVSYTGTIKAGYNLSDIETNLNRKDKEIEVTLPEVIIISNTIDEPTTKIIKKSILNPFDPNEVPAYIDEIAKPNGLKEAEERGLYDTAEESAKEQIESQLSCFEKYGYKVVFVSSVENN